jgi:hypothetical protein
MGKSGRAKDRVGRGTVTKGATPDVCSDGRFTEASSVGLIVGKSVGIMSSEDTTGV